MYKLRKVAILITAMVVMLSIAGCGELSEIDKSTKVVHTSKPGGIEYDISGNTLTYQDINYTIIEVDGGDRSGDREAGVAVDIGFGDREYWALTNEYGQLVHVLANEVILQDDDTEPVNKDGRYYDDEARVPGTEEPDLDQGHILADSLGGVANAYNITPQDSTLNRHGDQAYMEKFIRDVGGCTNFVSTIIYANENTQIPSSYRYEYSLNGETIIDEFENVNPDDYNENHGVYEGEKGDISEIDTNGNGIVTIKEAKEAGYAMPITSDHWLYQYMRDNDGNGMVGE